MGSEVLALPPDPSASALARRFVEGHTGGYPMEIVDDLLLIVSELVTNAVQHGEPEITFELNTVDGVISGRVSDGGTGNPVAALAPADPDSGHGRGLFIVNAYAAAWGVDDAVDGSGGKSVWFRLVAE